MCPGTVCREQSVAARHYRVRCVAAPAILSLCAVLCVSAAVRTDDAIETGRQAYESSDYPKAVQVLQEAVAKDPQNSEIYLLLAKDLQRDAVHDRQVNVMPVLFRWSRKIPSTTNGSVAPMAKRPSTQDRFPASRSPKKRARNSRPQCVSTRKISPRVRRSSNMTAAAPGIAGGGEDKVIPADARLAELDPAEGHYAAGNCRRQKKDFAAAEAEFTNSLDSHPKSANLIYDIGDYAMKHSQPDRLVAVADAGEKIAPSDPRQSCIALPSPSS